MKLISLNVWGGTLYNPLVEFIKDQSAEADIFCFQEVFSSLPGAPEVSSGARMFLFQELSQLLSGYNAFFELRSSGADFSGKVDAPISHGLASFVKKDIKVLNHGGQLVAKYDPAYAIMEEGDFKVQILSLKRGADEFSVLNYHGIATPGNKNDTDPRLSQSKKLAEIWQSLPVETKILCGDFNLNPDTQSIKILETCGRNLISVFKIENTRNQVSWDRFPGSYQKFADYTFVSPKIKVNSFEVPYNEVSDHLPMILKFNV